MSVRVLSIRVANGVGAVGTDPEVEGCDGLEAGAEVALWDGRMGGRAGAWDVFTKGIPCKRSADNGVCQEGIGDHNGEAMISLTRSNL